MASRATWRTVPGDPSSRRGYLAYTGRQWSVVALDQVSVGIVVLGICALIIGAFATSVALFVALWAVRQARINPVECPEAAEPSPGEAFCGTIEIRRDGALLGRDEVVVTFVEGWLHVEGRRTSFALSNADGVEPEPRPIDHLLAGVEEGSIRTWRPGHPRHPQVVPVLSNRLILKDGLNLRFGLRPRRDESSPVRYVLFAQSLACWREDAPATGESVLPPDEPHPLARTKASTDLVGAGLGFVIGVGMFVELGFAWLAVVWAMVLGASVYQAIVEVVRQRRVLRPG